jgi:pimeloyl-ACP methyl ester carboxylesterase
MRIEVDGVGVCVEVRGRGPATVLLVHGLGSSRECWSDAPRFFDPDRHTLVLPDLPGFGDSDKPEPHGYSMESLAAALRGVLDHVGAHRVHIVAHSMGGAVALLLAGSEGITTASFAAAEGNLVPEDAFMSSKVSRLKEAAFAKVFTKWLRMVEESLGPEPVRMHEVFLRDLRRTTPAVLHRASVSCQALTRSGELARRFGELGCPRMYLVGERTLEGRDLPGPVAAGGVEVVRIPGAGHFVMDVAEAFYPPIRRLVDAAEAA